MFKKKILLIFVLITPFFLLANAEEEHPLSQCIATHQTETLTRQAIADALGWVQTNDNRCGGYYFEPPFLEPGTLLKKNYLYITGDQGVFSLHSTSIYQGNVTITQDGQQIIANKAYVYREPKTEKYSAIDLIGHVILREPNDLVLARCGRIELPSKNKSLYDILYRTAIYGQLTKKPGKPTNQQILHEREITQLSAWGVATSFEQEEPKVYEFEQPTYTTCPPTTNVWQIKAKEIVLNKNTGRGVAKDARLYIKNVPIFYTPYLNFPIDSRRQTGFLWPKFGASSRAGNYLGTPFYLNLAPSYDDLITPTYMSKRGLQVANLYRYLTPHSEGEISATVLPGDRAFAKFKEDQTAENEDDTSSITESELRRLNDSSTTRKAFIWQDKTRLNENWSSKINFSYVSDDYYLKDFRNDLVELTPNQLLQEAYINYQSQYWQFLGRVQGYQTLHPIDQPLYLNQYIRLPQFVLEGDYVDEKTGLEYFIYNDITHFDIHKNPGLDIDMPKGNRMHTQPGISWPYYRPDFYFVPRLQFAMTQYELYQVDDDEPNNPSRALPIFDIHSGLFFDREITFFNTPLQQTLEPQIYYTYVPFRDQNDIPIFDTTLNTLSYDQLFTYNRFSGLDRIGDANQLSAGVTTRFIDQESGFEKIRAGIGQIIYFQDRRVTLCDIPDCSDSIDTEANKERLSPLSGMILYKLTPNWLFSLNSIWDPKTSVFNNQTVHLQYSNSYRYLLSLTYTYSRDLSIPIDEEVDEENDHSLSQTDLILTWPLTREWSTIARWTQNWNTGHFQNLLYGLQYDSCCWAIRLVAGRVFTNQTSDNSFEYNTEYYLQFALKGLGNFGTGNPGHIVGSTVMADKTYFGQDF